MHGFDEETLLNLKYLPGREERLRVVKEDLKVTFGKGPAVAKATVRRMTVGCACSVTTTRIPARCRR